MSEGIGDELHGIDLGDERLNKRSKHILEALADNPEASINAACDGRGDTIAADRFFDNTAVTPEEILRPHRQATIRFVDAQQQSSPRAGGTEHAGTRSGCGKSRVLQGAR